MLLKTKNLKDKNYHKGMKDMKEKNFHSSHSSVIQDIIIK